MARGVREQAIEVYPEADRLGDFPHPRMTHQLYGHEDAQAQLATGLAEGRLHHAWLLIGPSGIGKATLAYRFAKASLGGHDGGRLFGGAGGLEVDEAAHSSHLVRALSHPDLLVIRRPYDIKAKRFKTAITVDEVRRLRGFLGHKQSGLGLKVVIVDAADELNVNAANALLKSLEEPPAKVIFLLIASQPGRLLPTIRSRCRTLAMLPLGEADLRAASEQALIAAGMEVPDDNAWPALTQTADGRCGKLLTLASDEGLALAGKVDELFTRLRPVDWTAVHRLSDEFAAVGGAEKFETFIELVLARLARTVRAAAIGGDGGMDAQTAARLGVQGDLASWAELWETLVAEKATQDALNLDRKGYILDLVAKLSKLVPASDR